MMLLLVEEAAFFLLSANKCVDLNWALKIYTHQNLRKFTCEFALALKDPRVVTLGGNFNRNAIACKSRPWDVFFNDMKKSGTWTFKSIIAFLSHTSFPPW